ncbi:SIS domain-containing protein [Noviherbaspirillum galbum]|uniref:SIS domain-containing protein n=1 Tax=Noviherbaspirillum galbum TaxID=2709383 RepID=A0A6B3SXQ2_9BURK|nr:SIS domain-containing protein [Noviherbaspirillum galbum]NEX63312.1 SIS domain-containing protein [Noviherbaspirillum galbum]
MIEHVRTALVEAHGLLEQLLADEAALAKIVQASAILANSFARDGRAFSCGNGGSMCDAMHFAEELTGRFRKDRRGIAATAISDASHITCVANDFGYDAVFARYIEAHARPGDVLLAISTSGRSASVLNAVRAAQDRQVQVIGLTGQSSSELATLSDICICTPGGAYADRVQELHIKVIHILIELVERHQHPKLYE